MVGCEVGILRGGLVIPLLVGQEVEGHFDGSADGFPVGTLVLGWLVGDVLG